MYSIRLNGLEFYAFHGWYQEENLIGNKYIVDIHIKVEDSQIKQNDLNSTVNYEQVFNIVKNRMNIKYKLLEDFVKDVYADVVQAYPFVHFVEVSITKPKVPIDQIIGASQVVYSNTL